MGTLPVNISPPKCYCKTIYVCHQTDILLVTLKRLKNSWQCLFVLTERRSALVLFQFDVKMSFLNSSINPELSLTNSIEETVLKTTFGSNTQTALNHDKGKETSARDSLNTNEGQDRHDSITAVKECSTDDLFLNRKTTPSPKVLSWTTEEKETLPFVRSRHPRGAKVILLVLCLMCAAALGLSVLMLLGVLRPHGPPDTKIGKNESPRCLCNFFSLLSEIYQKQPQK